MPTIVYRGPGLQMLALAHQNALDQQGVIAFLKRATQLGAGGSLGWGWDHAWGT